MTHTPHTPPASHTRLEGLSIVPGAAVGEVLASDTAISLMLGVDVASGEVIDAHHPLRGSSLAGRVVVIPSGRGSCSASGALLEMILAGTAPAALVFCDPETILTLGSMIAEEFFGLRVPVVRLSDEDHRALRRARTAMVVDGVVVPDPSAGTLAEALRDGEGASRVPPGAVSREDRSAPDGSSGWSEGDPRPHLSHRVELSRADEAMLRGDHGEAAQRAMRVVLRAAALEGAVELVDVEQVHVDGNFFQGRGSLEFPERLVALGAGVRVPTTTNSLTIDRERWREVGVAAPLGEASERVADAYAAMGVAPSYTCAPYLLEGRPAFGEQIAWAESNAVVYANSVLGARTLKYPDYLDILVAITGRAPAAGAHLPAARRATTRIDVAPPQHFDDSLFPMLGHLVGEIAAGEIPVVCGLEEVAMSGDDLRAFGAAFATTSAAPMFHVVGHTPEAATVEQALGRAGRNDDRVRAFAVGAADLARVHRDLNTAASDRVTLVALGNPHFSLEEFRRLAERCSSGSVAPGTQLIVTCGRAIRERADAAGYLEAIERAGAQVLSDTCWCFIDAPIVPPASGVVMTNSAKYAHYGPGLLAEGMRFGSLDDCADAAFTGRAPLGPPRWLAAARVP